MTADETSAFQGKTAFITGAAQGFGRAFAEAFAARGAAVMLADINLEAATRAADEIAKTGGKARAVTCDVADEHAVERAVAATVEQLGGVDILINNAGRHLTKYSRPFGELKTQDVRDVFDVNVMGVIHCTMACRETMAARGGGVILNISSIAAFLSSGPYAITKLAVRGLTISFAKEFAPYHIRVNAIAPGLIATDSALADLDPVMMRSFAEDLQMVKRRGEVSDIVEAALFLCGERASFITGETLRVSGGYPLGI